MTITPIYRVRYRRRREGKTDYKKRLALLKSGRPRFVVRKSLSHFTCQVISFDPKGDITLASANSKELAKVGWLGHGGNTPSAYLTGMLCGIRAKKRGVKEAVLDIGIQRPSKGASIFAALKGALDAGLKIPHDPEIVPSQKRIRGEEIARYAEELKKRDPEKYKRTFSFYLKKGLDPSQISKHFDEIKGRVKEIA
jgi:large subunit ribosomal protein L18